MGSQNLNMMHEKVGGMIKGDRLPHINHLSLELKIRNFNILHKEDSNDIYLLIAQK